MHRCFANLLSAYKTVPILLEYISFFLILFVFLILSILNAHNLFRLLLFLLQSEMPTIKVEKKKQKWKINRRKLVDTRVVFPNGKKKLFAIHVEAFMSSSWFHINGQNVPFLVSLFSEHIFPFALSYMDVRVSFVSISFLRLPHCITIFFPHIQLLYLLHFVTSFGCMITSNLVSNLKCKFSMVIYTASTRRLVQTHSHLTYCMAYCIGR